MGKNKDKAKDKDKAKRKDDDRPGRKDLIHRVEALEAENEALRARLERIAEIAGAPAPAQAESAPESLAVLVDGQIT